MHAFTRRKPIGSYFSALLVLSTVGCGTAAPEPVAPSTPEAPRPNASETTPVPMAKASSDEAEKNEAPPAPKLTRPAEPLNVLLILVDSMRSDMPWAGYPRDIAPNLTELEKNSVSYTRGYSMSSVTAKSIGGLLAGKYPSTIARNKYFDTTYSRSNLFFPEVLEKHGVKSMATHAHTYMGGPGNKGLDQGFAQWTLLKGLTYPDMKGNPDITAHRLTKKTIEMLEATPNDKPFFFYTHYMDPHHQYLRHDEAPDWGKKARDRYDQEIFFADMHIGKLLAYMKSQPWWSKTAVIVSADHGESFGEHKHYKHAFELWEQLVQVPIFLHVPGATPRRIDTPRGHIDLAPTILDLMGAERSDEWDFLGQSLVPELFGAKAEPRPVLVDLPRDTGNMRRHGVIHGDYKLLAFGDGGYTRRLFNLKADPGELKDLAKTAPEEMAKMEKVYAETWGKLKLVRPH